MTLSMAQGTLAEIVEAHRIGAHSPEATIADCYARIRAHSDPAVFISLRDESEARAVMRAVTRTCREADTALLPVAAGYADYRRFGGLDPQTIVRVARDSDAALVMLDTAIKDGASLFDALDEAELAAFASAARAAGLGVALAGSVGLRHLAALRRIGADVVGIRGAVCRGGDRRGTIDAALVRDFIARARMPAADAPPTGVPVSLGL